MTDERRYTDEEVDAILALALTPDAPGRPVTGRAQGLTLTALQEVGLEVGVSPERIAAAAREVALDRAQPARETSLGMPIGVRRAIVLPRPPSEPEWDAVVALLQQTFRARGRAAALADAHIWTNGNLRVTIERTADGTQLELDTHKGGARDVNRIGVAALGLGTILLGVVLAGISPPAVEQGLLWSVAIGAGALVGNVLRLRDWARTRERQMEDVARRVRAMLAHPSRDPEG